MSPAGMPPAVAKELPGHWGECHGNQNGRACLRPPAAPLGRPWAQPASDLWILSNSFIFHVLLVHVCSTQWLHSSRGVGPRTEHILILLMSPFLLHPPPSLGSVPFCQSAISLFPVIYLFFGSLTYLYFRFLI